MDNTPSPQPHVKPTFWNEFINFVLKGNAIGEISWSARECDYAASWVRSSIF